MKILLRRAFVDGEATLATMNRVAARRLAENVIRRCQPLLYVALAVLTLLIFDCADCLPGQKSTVLAGLLSARLDCFGLNSGNASIDHSFTPI